MKTPLTVTVILATLALPLAAALSAPVAADDVPCTGVPFGDETGGACVGISPSCIGVFIFVHQTEPEFEQCIGIPPP